MNSQILVQFTFENLITIYFQPWKTESTAQAQKLYNAAAAMHSQCPTGTPALV